MNDRAQMALDSTFRQIIAGFRNSSGWDEALDLCLLQALWPRIAGGSVARNTEVVGFSGQRLVIRVPDQAWSEQLQCIRGELLEKINERWPGGWIREIRFTHEDHTR